MTSTFEQSVIPVERKEEFSELKGAIDRVFAPPQVKVFLRALQKEGIGVRDFDAVLAGGLLERADKKLSSDGTTAKGLYANLSMSDQGLIREFYLERLEQVDAVWRARYAKVFRVL
jgi:hypothetical protein